MTSRTAGILIAVMFVGIVCLLVFVPLIYVAENRQHNQFISDCHARDGHIVKASNVRLCVSKDGRLI